MDSKKLDNILENFVNNTSFLLENIESAKLSFEDALYLVAHNGLIYKHLPKEFRGNRDIAIKALDEQPQAYKYFPLKFKNKKSIINLLLDKNIEYFVWLPKNIRESLEIGIKVVSTDASKYKHLCYEQRKDDLIAFCALSKNGRMLEFLPEEKKHDPRLLLYAVQSSIWAYTYFPQDIKDAIGEGNEKDYLMKLIQKGNLEEFLEKEIPEKVMLPGAKKLKI